MRRIAPALVLALVLGALARALVLEQDPYDAYEVRTAARAVAGDRAVPFPLYRSALLSLVEAPFEGLAHGSRATWVFPHVLGALAYGGLALAAVALARAAGASREASWAAGVAVALDRLAFADAPLGLPDALAAGLGALGLARGLAALEAPGARRAVGVGLVLGLAAAARPNAGLACAALGVAAIGAELARAPRKLTRSGPLATAILAGAVALASYLFLETLFFTLGRGSFTEGLRAHAELARFQREQFAENARKYGSLFPPLAVYSRASFFMEPWTALLAPVALAFALIRGGWREAALAIAAILQVAFLALLVGHGEARYLLPALVPMAALAALALDRIASSLGARIAPARRPLALAALGVAWVALPLALGARFELARARDPVLGASFSARVADAVARVSSSTSRVFWTPDLPFPVYPIVLAREGTPFRGDPFHGIFHAGPLTVAYHLGRPIGLLRVQDEHGQPLPGVASRAGLEALVRGSPSFREGDVILLGAPEPGLSWALPREAPVLEVLRVRGSGEERTLETVARVGPLPGSP